MVHSDAITFLPFKPQLAEHFKLINLQWIEQMFVLEAADEAVLNYPQKQIVDTGGYIWFASHPSPGVVGTCALMQRYPGVFELTKMWVLSSGRGCKVGELLLQHVLQQVYKLPIQRLFLLTNKKCQAAIHLYEKNNFVHSQQIMDEFAQAYARCDVAMVYPLS